MASTTLQTVLDKSVLAEVQWHTLEPYNGGASFDSGMWKTEDVVGSLHSTYAAFIAQTRTKAYFKAMPVIAGQYRYNLNDISQGLIDILRMGWGSVLALYHIWVDAATGTTPKISPTSIYTGWVLIQADSYNTDRIRVTSDSGAVGIDLWPGSSITVRADRIEDDRLVAVDLADIEIGGTTGDGVNVLYWQHFENQLPALHREDTFAFDQIRPSWKATPGMPMAYSMITQPLAMIDLMPSPSANGALNIWYTCIPSELNGTGVPLSGIAPEFCYHIKYGTMAMILGNEGPPNDPKRADYCDIRLQEGIELAKMICDEAW